MHLPISNPQSLIVSTVFVFAAASLGGCGEQAKPLPATYPVHGKVTYQDGKPVADAMVRFHPESEPRVVTSAVTGNDGAYSLVTQRNGLRAAGAVAGPNRVTVVHTRNGRAKPQANGVAGQQPMGIVSTDFPTPYEVQPRDNEINLTVERPRR